MKIRAKVVRKAVVFLSPFALLSAGGCGGCGAGPDGSRPVFQPAGKTAPTASDSSLPSTIAPADVPEEVLQAARGQVPGFVVEKVEMTEGTMLHEATYFLTGKATEGKSLKLVVARSGFKGFEGPIPLSLVPPRVLTVATAQLPGVTIDGQVAASTSAWNESSYGFQGTGPAGDSSTIEVGGSGRIYSIGRAPVALDKVPPEIMDEAKKKAPDVTFEHASFTKPGKVFGLAFREYYELTGVNAKKKIRHVKVKVPAPGTPKPSP